MGLITISPSDAMARLVSDTIIKAAVGVSRCRRKLPALVPTHSTIDADYTLRVVPGGSLLVDLEVFGLRRELITLVWLKAHWTI